MNKGIEVQTGFYIICAIAMLFVPVPWLMAWMCAVFIHEFSHFIALKILKIQIFRISVRVNGVLMETEEGNNLKMSICALAGPLGGLSPALLLHTAPRLALCAIFLSAYNLLPIYPLDGGRAVRGLVQHFFTHKTAYKIICSIEYAAILLIFAASIFASIYLQLGALPIFCFGWLVFQNKKYLANKINKRYNSCNSFLRGTNYDTKATANLADSAKTCPLHWRRI